MRKKISVDNVQKGMYIDELCGSWMDYPFWKSSFKLEKDKDLKSLLSCGVRELWIDTKKGIDVKKTVNIVKETEATVQTDQVLNTAATKTNPYRQQVSLEQELDKARKIQTMAVQSVTNMFLEVRMGKALDTTNAVPLTNEIYLSVVRNPGALISLTRLKNKDDYTYMHSVAVCALMIALGRQMGLDEAVVKSLGMAGLLHDVGKMAIDNDILNKPGALTDDEFNTVKSHPMRGWEMLNDSEHVDDIAKDVCLHHHERVDGNGYPEKLSADSLSLYAKMGAVCDVYDAITSDRSYKKGWSPSESIRKMASWKDGHFDNAVFDSFVKTIGIYPVGSLLKLRSGRLAVVTDQSAKNLLKPKVKIFYSTNSGSHISPRYVDLDKTEDDIIAYQNPSDYGFDMNKIIG